MGRLLLLLLLLYRLEEAKREGAGREGGRARPGENWKRSCSRKELRLPAWAKIRMHRVRF
jgi:hypothetical protein